MTLLRRVFRPAYGEHCKVTVKRWWSPRARKTARLASRVIDHTYERTRAAYDAEMRKAVRDSVYGMSVWKAGPDGLVWVDPSSLSVAPGGTMNQQPMSGLGLPQRDFGAAAARRERDRYIRLFNRLEKAVTDELARNPDADALGAAHRAVMREACRR